MPWRKRADGFDYIRISRTRTFQHDQDGSYCCQKLLPVFDRFSDEDCLSKLPFPEYPIALCILLCRGLRAYHNAVERAISDDSMTN